MREVVLDGEAVAFEGPPPESLSLVRQLIEQHLSSAGRVLHALQVDGVARNLEVSDEVEDFRKVEFTSVSFLEKLREMVAQWIEACNQGIDTQMQVAASALSLPWKKAQQETVLLLESLRPVLEGCGILEQFAQQNGAAWQAAFSESFQACVASIDAVIETVQSGDCVRLSDQLAIKASSSWTALRETLASTVLPQLEEMPDV